MWKNINHQEKTKRWRNRHERREMIEDSSLRITIAVGNHDGWDGMKFLHIKVLPHEALALIEAHSSQAHTQSDASPGIICISCWTLDKRSCHSLLRARCSVSSVKLSLRFNGCKVPQSESFNLASPRVGSLSLEWLSHSMELLLRLDPIHFDLHKLLAGLRAVRNYRNFSVAPGKTLAQIASTLGRELTTQYFESVTTKKKKKIIWNANKK